MNKSNILLIVACFVATTLAAQFDRPVSAGLPPSVPATDFGGRHAALLNDANILVRSGRTEQAIITYDAILSQFPDWIPALTGKANVLQLVGRDIEADQYRKRALRIDPIATGFIMSKRGNGIIRYLALYPGTELVLAKAAHAKTDEFSQQDYFTYQLTTIMGLPDSVLLAEVLQAKVAGDWVASTQALHKLMEDQVIDEDLGFMIEGNLDMLNHDYLGAVAAYNQALDFHTEPWPEATYNRGLAFILLDNFTNGCAELSNSAQRGFEPAQIMLKSLCNF